MQMQHNRIHIQYQLIARSSWHCGTGLNNGLTDRGMARDSEGYAYIPGSTIKGLLRHHATRLACILGWKASLPHTGDLQSFSRYCVRDIPDLIFGSQYRPGTLYFDDVLLCNEDCGFFKQDGQSDWLAQQSETRIRVGLSRVTNTARAHHLFSTEYGIPDLRFEGTLFGFLPGIALRDPDLPPYTLSLILLVAALSSLDAVGGDKSIGAGRMACNISSVQMDGESVNASDIVAALEDIWGYATELWHEERNDT